MAASALSASAEIVALEDHRYVRAQDDNYGNVGSVPFTPFSDFHGRAEGFNGIATQDSWVAGTSMGGQSAYETYGGNGTQHDSTYEIVFRVDEPSRYAFSGSGYSVHGVLWEPGDGPDDVRAALRAGSTELFSAAITRNEPNFADAGDLTPRETYTLSVWSRARPPGWMFHKASWNFAFTVVPELDLAWYLASAALLVLARRGLVNFRGSKVGTSPISAWRARS